MSDKKILKGIPVSDKDLETFRSLNEQVYRGLDELYDVSAQIEILLVMKTELLKNIASCKQSYMDLRLEYGKDGKLDFINKMYYPEGWFNDKKQGE